MLKSAVWFTTMACNFKCKYCWEVQHQEHGHFKAAPFGEVQPWIDGWNRLKPAILDVTGGEPLMIPWMMKFFNETDPAIKFGLTTNLSTNVYQLPPAERFVNITCSWHPTENGTRNEPNNLYVFTGRALYLKNRGYPITINYVGWPEQIWLADHFKSWFESHGLRFHFDPYSWTEYYPITLTDAEKSVVERLASPSRKPRDLDHVLCSGGIDHLSVQPDGSAWRCILDRQLGLNPLGSILDPDFKLLDDRRECHEVRRCPGCDRDKVTVVSIS